MTAEGGPEIGEDPQTLTTVTKIDVASSTCYFFSPAAGSYITTDFYLLMVEIFTNSMHCIMLGEGAH